MTRLTAEAAWGTVYASFLTLSRFLELLCTGVLAQQERRAHRAGGKTRITGQRLQSLRKSVAHHMPPSVLYPYRCLGPPLDVSGLACEGEEGGGG